MFKRLELAFLTMLSLGLLAACSSTPPYTPVASQSDPIDVTAYAPKVDSFVVILDTSSSMREDDKERPRIETAQDLVASFNSAIPALDFQAGLVTFGKDSGRCIGTGMASPIYGMASYQSADFATALASIECAGGTTPMSEGIQAATAQLSGTTGPIAVILVSDFQWLDSSAVTAAVGRLKAQHPNKLCLHTIKVGNETSGDALIADITAAAGCDSAVGAADIASASAMSTYVTETLMGPLQYEKHTVSATALFDFDKSIVKEQGKAELHNLSELIKSQGMSVGDIDVVGHTDNVGSEQYNQDLSARRALAVKDYLVSAGVDAGIIDVSGKGKSEPVASNDTEQGRALNRRVEIHVGTSRPTK
jgi:OmpA-OmpF porin, OOP family